MAVPVFGSWTRKKRNVFFPLLAVGGALFAFLVLGFTTQSFLAAVIFGPLLGLGAALALVGRPDLRRKDGRPVFDEKTRPWLFFPSLVLSSLLAYVFLGLALTPVVPLSLLAYVTLATALLTGAGVSYVAFGFPRLDRLAKSAWGEVPPEDRPWLFFPAFVLFSILLFFLVGLAVNESSLPLELQPLVALPAALVLAAPAAYLLFGFPKPKRNVLALVPPVTGQHRPLAFFVTGLLVGAPLTVAAGILLQEGPVPQAAILAAAVAAGNLLSFAFSALLWGTPRRWRRFEDYDPRIPEETRLTLLLPVTVGIAGAVVAAFAIAGLDLFPGILLGLVLGFAAGLWASGVLTALRESRPRRRTILPELPDMMKPLMLFALWAFGAGVLFTVLTYALPSFFAWNLLGSALVGFALAFYLVEEALVREALGRRRQARERQREMKRRREDALGGTRGPRAGE